MTSAEQHAAVLDRLERLEGLARAAQPGGAWYREGRNVAAEMPLLSRAEMEELHPDQFEDWVFTAATTADALYIAAQHPAAVVAQLVGRRRIVERHAPRTDHGRPNAVTWCDHRLCYEDRETWPCDDYRDAAADLLPPDTEG